MTTIRLAEWAILSTDEQLEAIAKAKPNGAAVRVAAEIRAFEDEFGFDSDEMRRRLRMRELHESWNVCQWLSLLHRRDLLEQARAE